MRIEASRPRRRRVALAMAAAALVAADQIVLYFALSDGYFLGRRIAPYDPPLFSDHHREGFSRLQGFIERNEGNRADFAHDAELGWAPPKEASLGEGLHDWSGSRIGTAPLARQRSPGVRRIVAVGCSFTFGAEVAGEEAWPAARG